MPAPRRDLKRAPVQSHQQTTSRRGLRLLARLVVEWPVAMLGFGLLLVAIAAVAARGLRFQTEVIDLLPSDSRAAADYSVMLDRFGGFEKVFVVIESPPPGDTDQVISAAEQLTSILNTSPLVESARAGISPEDEAFFLTHVAQRCLLVMGNDWRERLARAVRPAALRARAEEIRRAVISPAGFLSVEIAKVDPLGLMNASWPGAGILNTALPVDPMTMAFVSEDDRAALVIITPSTSDMSPATGRELRAELEAAFAEVRAVSDPNLRFLAVGGPLYAAADEALIKNDLKRTVTSSAIGCFLLMVLAFGGLSVPAAILVAVGAAVVLTAGVLALTVGEVSALAAGFAAVLMGLGIDYGIHGCVRFRQGLLDGMAVADAVRCSFAEAGPGIVSSALTTVVAFAVLALAVMKPLRDLGLIGALGILMILGATVLVGAPLVTAISMRSTEQRSGGALWQMMGRGVELAVRAGTSQPVLIVVCTVALTVVSMIGLTRVRVHTDLRAVRPADNPMLEAEQVLAEKFGLGSGTVSVVVSGRNLNEAATRASMVVRRVEAALGEKGHVTFPEAMIRAIGNRPERLAELRSMDLEPALQRLEQEMRDVNLDPSGFSAGFNALRELNAGRDPSPLSLGSRPPWMDGVIRIDRDGVWVLVTVRHDSDVWIQGPPEDLVRELKEIAPGAAIASVPAIGHDLERLSRRDLKRLGVAALAAVFVVVALSFRGSIKAAAVALVPVILGSIWLFGLWGWAGGSIDVVSIAVLPLMLGIGIDDGLHAVHGARSRAGQHSIAESVRDAGRAMVLTTLTTCVGFGSLAFSSIPGLRNGGLLVSFGVALCLCATLIVLPAIERWWMRPRP